MVMLVPITTPLSPVTVTLSLIFPRQLQKKKRNELEDREIRDEKVVSYHHIPFYFDTQDLCIRLKE